MDATGHDIRYRLARPEQRPGASGLRELPMPKHHAEQMTATISPNPTSGCAP